jgi:hypothetical protein
MTSTMHTGSNARPAWARLATVTDRGGLLMSATVDRLRAGARPVLCGLARVQRELPLIMPEAAPANLRRWRRDARCRTRRAPARARMPGTAGCGSGRNRGPAQRSGPRASGQRTPADLRPVPARRAPRRRRPRVDDCLRVGQELESPRYRQEVRDLLGLAGHPQLLIQLGRSNTAPATPRRPQVELRTD